jgi:hypothetical protein
VTGRSLRVAAALPPLAAVVAAALGRLQIHPDQWREWLGAAEGFGATVGSSAFGAVSPVYKFFLPTALTGGDPQGWWGVPWLLLLAVLPFLLPAKARALAFWTAAAALPPAAYWLDNHAITASISYAASALALAFLLADRPVRAVWAGALALAVYPVGGAAALAVGLTAFFSARGNAARLRILGHGVVAALAAALPYLAFARDPALSRGAGGALGTPIDAATFLVFGAWPAFVLAALSAVAWLRIAKARPALTAALLQWAIAACLLPLKTDWWAGYYAVTTTGLILAALAAALPRPDRLTYVWSLVGVIMVAGLAGRPEVLLRSDAFWQAKRPDEPWHFNVEQHWSWFNAAMQSAAAARLEGDGHAFLRWAIEHRDQVVDERTAIRMATSVPSPRCPDAAPDHICVFDAVLVDGLPLGQAVLVLRISNAGAPSGALATVNWVDCRQAEEATSETIMPSVWAHQTTLSVGAGLATAPQSGCRATAAPHHGDLLLIDAGAAEGPAAAVFVRGQPPYIPRRF